MAGLETVTSGTHEPTPEDKFAQVTARLKECLEGNTRLTVTQSQAGDNRVRAFIPDEDGYAGWTELASFTGVAQISQEGHSKYVAERHFPYQTGRPTYLWEFTPDTNELLVSRQDGAGNTPQLPIKMPADAEHIGYFSRLVSDVYHAYGFNDYEKDLLIIGKYDFQLEELR